MSTALATLAGKLAERVGMDSVDPQELITTLRQTAFKGDASDAQFIALLIVANQYGLNPWTKEIYAFPDKQNGIVPVVGVDGWSRIINENQQFDGMDFEFIYCIRTGFGKYFILRKFFHFDFSVIDN
jgi:phage recombination protein Bet